MFSSFLLISIINADLSWQGFRDYKWDSEPLKKMQVEVKDSFDGKEFMICTVPGDNKEFCGFKFDSLVYRYNENKLKAVNFIKQNSDKKFYEQVKETISREIGKPVLKENIFISVYKSSWTINNSLILLEFLSGDFDDGDSPAVEILITPADNSPYVD